MNKIIIYFLCFIINDSLNAQDYALSVSTRFGTPTQFLDFFHHPDPQNPTSPDVNLSDNIISTSDLGALSKFSYRVFKKLELHGVVGIEFASSKYYKLVVFEGRRLDVISFDNNRLAVNIGAFKRFSFYDNRLLLDFGFSFQKRFFFRNSQTFNQELRSADKPVDWIDYEYELKTFHNGKCRENGFKPYKVHDNIHFELNSSLSFQFYKNLYFSLGFDYNRNHVFYFDYYGRADLKKTVLVTEPDGSQSYQETIETIEQEPYIGENGAKRSVRSHFLYLNFGLSWRF